MPADSLTKALNRQKHKTFVKQLGLVDITTLLVQTEGVCHGKSSLH
jgi:hypothetical protein